MLMPGHLPRTKNTIVVNGLKIAIVHIARVVVGGKAECSVTADLCSSRIAASIGGSYSNHLAPVVVVGNQWAVKCKCCWEIVSALSRY